MEPNRGVADDDGHKKLIDKILMMIDRKGGSYNIVDFQSIRRKLTPSQQDEFDEMMHYLEEHAFIATIDRLVYLTKDAYRYLRAGTDPDAERLSLETKIIECLQAERGSATYSRLRRSCEPREASKKAFFEAAEESLFQAHLIERPVEGVVSLTEKGRTGFLPRS